MLSRAILCLILMPSVALASGPRWFQRGVHAEGTEADVRLVRGVATQGRPAVQVEIGERAALAILDVVSGPSRIGRELAQTLGLTIESRVIHGQQFAVTELPTVQIGDLTLRGVRARVTSGDRLILGLGAVPRLSVALLASEGRVRVVPGRAGQSLLEGFETPQMLQRQPAGTFRQGGERHVGDGLTATVEVQLGELSRRLAVRTDIARSRIQPGILPGIETADGVRRVHLEGSVGGVDLAPALVMVDGGWMGTSQDEVGVLGYDLLYRVDLARVGDRLALRAAPTVTWDDPAQVQISAALARLNEWNAERGGPPPDDGPARMGFGPGPTLTADPEAVAFHQELSEALWNAGATDLAVQRAMAATTHAPDRCLPHLALGERRLRTAGPQLAQELLGDLIRGPLIEAGRLAAQGGQPEDCGRALGLLMGAWLAVGELDEVTALYEANREAHWSVSHLMGVSLLASNPRAAEAHLRDAILAGGRDDVDVRLAMARAQAAQGRTEPAKVWLQTLAWRAGDHPLTAALIAAALQPPLPPLHVEPGLIAAHIAAAVHGAEVDLDAVEEALFAAEQRWPGMAQLEAMRAVWLTLGGEPVPAPTDRAHLADVWAAQAVIAAKTGDLQGTRDALRELHTRFPEIPAADLGLAP